MHLKMLMSRNDILMVLPDRTCRKQRQERRPERPVPALPDIQAQTTSRSNARYLGTRHGGANTRTHILRTRTNDSPLPDSPAERDPRPDLPPTSGTHGIPKPSPGRQLSAAETVREERTASGADGVDEELRDGNEWDERWGDEELGWLA